ncbi:MAG: hypothetical protein HYT37_04290 [Candidatus Sungbacteria bacterium]|nr:hypothetical protein [Candidatus Sungbacteria bacterium]
MVSNFCELLQKGGDGMDRFGEFLRDMAVSFCLAAAIFIVIFLMMANNKSYDLTHSRNKENLYRAFQHESSPKTEALGGSEQYAALLRTLFSSKKADKQAIFFDDLASADFAYYGKIFHDLLPRERLALLMRSTEINTFVARENAYRETRKNDSIITSAAGWAFFVWKFASVACIFVVWTKESYVMAYFPYREWWFWIYSLLAFPWSIGIWTVIGYSFLRRNMGSGISKSARVNEEERYNLLCKEIAAEKEIVLERWMDRFPPYFIKMRTDELRGAISELKDRVDAVAETLEQAQGKYFSAKKELEDLCMHGEESAFNESRKEEWRMEFEAILAIPHVRAADVQHGYLNVFTDVFQSSSGGVGPFRIEIGLSDNKFTARIGHGGVLRGSTGLSGERDTFCFGNAHGTILGAIYRRHYCEAVKFMMHSFQTNALQ